jgi:type II restriction enzyme
MILKSRKQYKSSEDFRDKFLDTITPGVIRREDFIKWNMIFEKTKKYKIFFNFFKQIDSKNREQCINQLADALMSADIAMDFIDSAFELLGHTGTSYVSDQDYIDFKSFSEFEKDEHQMLYIAKVLVDLGICNVLKLEIDDYFTGVQVGLETHRRKNIGGTAFSSVVNYELEKIVKKINSAGHNIILKKEQKIYYSDKTTSKTLDFYLQYKNKIIGIEVNFYTASGSKPTEIKRSYGHVNKELEKVNASLVWITDGIGYMQMKKSLKEAVDIHNNTYNFNMMKDFLEEDIIDFFEI